jgi:uncharacterized protein YrrD
LLNDVVSAAELSSDQLAPSPNSTCWIKLSLYIDIFKEEASFQRLEDVWFDESAGRIKNLRICVALTSVRSLAEDGMMDRMRAIQMGGP